MSCAGEGGTVLGDESFRILILSASCRQSRTALVITHTGTKTCLKPLSEWPASLLAICVNHTASHLAGQHSWRCFESHSVQFSSMFGAIDDIGRNDYPSFDPDVNLGNIRDAGGRTTILFRARARHASPLQAGLFAMCVQGIIERANDYSPLRRRLAGLFRRGVDLGPSFGGPFLGEVDAGGFAE